MTSFALTSLFLFLIMLMRYFSVAGFFYLLVWKRPLRWRERELNSDKPRRSAITREGWNLGGHKSTSNLLATAGLTSCWALCSTWRFTTPIFIGRIGCFI